MSVDGMADMDEVTISLEAVLASLREKIGGASRAVDDSTLTPLNGSV